MIPWGSLGVGPPLRNVSSTTNATTVNKDVVVVVVGCGGFVCVEWLVQYELYLFREVCVVMGRVCVYDDCSPLVLVQVPIITALVIR